MKDDKKVDEELSNVEKDEQKAMEEDKPVDEKKPKILLN